MTYLAIGLVVAWCCGLVLLARKTLNLIRPIYNNIAPGKDHRPPGNAFRFYFLSFRFLTDAGAISPANLTEVSQQYRKRAILTDRILLAWALGGFVLLVWASSQFRGS